MASQQPDAGAVTDGQPGDRLPAPGPSSQIPFTRITAEHLATLEPEERLAFKMAAAQTVRDQNPGINTTATLLLTIQRLITEPASTAGVYGAAKLAAIETHLPAVLDALAHAAVNAEYQSQARRYKTALAALEAGRG